MGTMDRGRLNRETWAREGWLYGLRRRAWWGLAAFAVLILLFGAGDIFLGAGADPGIARGVTWRTPAELEAESAEAYRMFDRTARTQALSLVVMGVLSFAIVLRPYRRREIWAWWLMWVLPAWAFSVPVTYLAFGLAPGTPPPPLISKLIIGALAVVIVIIDRQQFTAVPVVRRDNLSA